MREQDINGLIPIHSWIEPETSVCPLTRSQTRNLLVYSMTLELTEPPGQAASHLNKGCAGVVSDPVPTDAGRWSPGFQLHLV